MQINYIKKEKDKFLQIKKINNARIYRSYTALKTPTHIIMNSLVDFTKNLNQLEWNRRPHQTDPYTESSKSAKPIELRY